MANGLNTGLGSGSPWDRHSIWSNGYANGTMPNGSVSRDVAVENTASREGAQQIHTNVAEDDAKKMGSSTLLESSESDDRIYKAPWASTRVQPAGRSTAQTQHNDPSGFQHRSVSSVGLSTPLSAAAHSSYSAFPPRPQTINLNGTATAQSRARMMGPYTGAVQGRVTEQPPNVYTKFNRASDPNTAKLPDSAKEGLFAEYSPTDTRKPSLSQYGGAPFSKPPSRDGNNQPSSYYGNDTPVYTDHGYPQSNRMSSQNSSRGQSISSSRMSSYNAHTQSQFNSDELVKHLSQIQLNNENRFLHFSRPPNPSAASWGLPSSGPINGPSPATRCNSVAEDGEDSDEAYGFDGHPALMHGRGNSITMPRARPGSSYDANAGQLRPFSQRSMAADFHPGRSYSTGMPPVSPIGATRSFSVSGAPMDLQRHGSQLIHMPESGLWFDPTAQQVIAPHRATTYGQILDPYALSPAMYGQSLPMPMHIPANLSGMEDTTGREGMVSAVLNDFKTNPKSRRYELKDIYGYIPEFSGDQHGSRFIQTKLETANSDEKEHVFNEILPNAIILMQDVFGNYVIQKFFEHGDQRHKKILASRMKDRVLDLTMSMYGCRVVQKAIDHILVEQQIELISELRGSVLECVQNQNGNHVIQKAIERCDPATTQFIIESFEGHVQSLSVHSYGCRVIQRCLERDDLPANVIITRELLQGINNMIGDQYGNYVVQHVVRYCTGEGKRNVMDIVGANLEMYSKHKFASNVVEKCLQFSDDEWRRKVVNTIAHANPRRGEGDGVFVGMIKDLYGNYVIRTSSALRSNMVSEI